MCRYLYWSINRPRAKIVRSLLDGSNWTTIVDSGISSPAALSVDLSTGDIYWTDVIVDAIQVRCSVCRLYLAAEFLIKIQIPNTYRKIGVMVWYKIIRMLAIEDWKEEKRRRRRRRRTTTTTTTTTKLFETVNKKPTMNNSTKWIINCCLFITMQWMHPRMHRWQW